METKKTWYIKTSPFKHMEMKTIACAVMGLQHQQMADCLHRSVPCVKFNLSKVYGKLEVNSLHLLALMALTKGFDRNGLYKGEQLLSPEEQRLANLLRPPHL
jgi:DNA-binding CsgD family transcriptional regulator